MEKRKINLLITLILTISLISASVFVSFDQSSVSAETGSGSGTNSGTGASDANLEQIDELTLSPDSDAKYDGYIVKIEDGKENRVDEAAVEDYESTVDNEFVVVEDPADTLDFVEPEYVEYIEPNYRRFPMNEGSEALSQPITAFAYSGANKAQYSQINLPEAWGLGYSGIGSDVVVLDSGLNTANTHLAQSKIGQKKSFLNANITTNVTDGLGHGSFVSGMIVASSPAIRGVAYASTMNPYKVINSQGYGNVSDLILALDYLVNKSGIYPDVVNMSFGGPDYSTSEYNRIKKLTNNGTIVVAAAGNEGYEGSPYNYPANYSNVIGVGSVDSRGSVSGFSQKNSSVMVVAPGEYLSSLRESGFSGLTSPSPYNSGTSYSAPIVAGAVALFDATGAPGISRSKFLTLIKTTSKDICNSGPDIYSGYGIIDIGEMAKKVDKGVSQIANSYKIAYELRGARLSGCVNTIHTAGTATALPTKSNTTKRGYIFSHWIDQNGRVRTSIPSSYSGDLTLTPAWISKKYSLKFKGNGGKIRVASKKVSYYKAIGSLKAPKKRKGYNFLGWFTKKSGGSQYYKGMKYKVAGNKTLYARWTKSKIVKFNANKGIVKKYAKTITKWKKFGTLPKPTRSGYRFKGWYTKKSGGKKVTKNTQVTRSGNITLYAHWKRK